jgi:hypothetical protein
MELEYADGARKREVALRSCFRHAGLEVRADDLADPHAAFRRAAEHARGKSRPAPTATPTQYFADIHARIAELRETPQPMDSNWGRQTLRSAARVWLESESAAGALLYEVVLRADREPAAIARRALTCIETGFGSQGFAELEGYLAVSK